MRQDSALIKPIEDAAAACTEQQERLLIKQASQGDHRAFTQLLQNYDRRIINVILRFTGNRYDRDDLFQEIFTACYLALPKFSGKSSFYTWLYRIALNHCISYTRSQRPMEAIEDISQQAQSLQRQLQLNTISNAVETLKSPQRISFHLYYIEQWTTAEIAQLLECRVGSVKSHLDRARKKIRLNKEVAKWQII
ncbi:MAG: hypothetical protein COC19_03245 [SAR86 cluster bacterium]|uniref:RNA polymerase subunit sigma-70 n=1 Tax=SAR86 cluster bacterium TaxID=2030880 RepID=A0A2A4MQI1_9GAMM|nr:MAG: hypothetical protein COC19_03245 [SAR86 cluster bacterium]